MPFLNTRLGVYLNRVRKETVNSIMRHAYNERVLAQMEDLNTKQLDDGLYSDGKDTPDYSPYTRGIKRAEGKIFQYMTFEDTGETRKSIKYTYTGGKLKVSIEDYHNLLTTYSQNIIGLTMDSISNIQDEIIENIQEKFKP